MGEQIQRTYRGQSLPTRERGLKLVVNPVDYFQRIMSLPTRERGLKYIYHLFQYIL